MKAIVTELQNGFKTYMVFESDVNSIFSKIVKNTGFHYIQTENDFDELKEDWFPLELKMYSGPGIYNNNGDNLGQVLIDLEDKTRYYIDHNYKQTGGSLKIVNNNKIIIKSPLFN